ncbi:MAG TPA: RnfABCDGE type electron transport complex subunit D [Bryobacteraceae bacterium]|nr:RnfABCDGE type electron transport complex subunit D [Bryobacteraceae bacterium]
MRRKTRRAKNFFKTPKGLLTIILSLLIAIAAPHEGLGVVAPGLLSAIVAAGLFDLVVLRARKKIWEFPSGAVLTAMIVSMVLRAQEPWYVIALTSVAAVLSKYIFRSRSANLFNPAALAIVASFYVFHTGQNWWGALPEVAPLIQLVLIAAGFFMADRVNKLPMVLAFLGSYYLLFTATAFLGDPAKVAEIFRTPDLQASLFFAFIILTDPPTSPTKYPDQLWCGVITALVAYAVFEWVGAVYYLLAGVLVANVWEAWRRVNQRHGYTFPNGFAAFLREMTPWRMPSHRPAR